MDKLSGKQLAPSTVIPQFVDLEARGVRDMAGELSPDAVVVGKGEALVFTAGKVYQAVWERGSLAERTVYRGSQGEEIAISPGQTWIHLLPRSIRVAYH